MEPEAKATTRSETTTQDAASKPTSYAQVGKTFVDWFNRRINEVATPTVRLGTKTARTLEGVRVADAQRARARAVAGQGEGEKARRALQAEGARTHTQAVNSRRADGQGLRTALRLNIFRQAEAGDCNGEIDGDGS